MILSREEKLAQFAGRAKRFQSWGIRCLIIALGPVVPLLIYSFFLGRGGGMANGFAAAGPLILILFISPVLILALLAGIILLIRAASARSQWKKVNAKN